VRAIKISKIVRSGPTVSAKNKGPTTMRAPLASSDATGKSVPPRMIRPIERRRKLFIISPVSLDNTES
jgi:hypothetical protein